MGQVQPAAPGHQQLARHVHTGQIVARIRLGKAFFFRQQRGGGQRHAFIQFTEDKGQRTGQNTVEANQLIAGVQQVLQVLASRQPNR